MVDPKDIARLITEDPDKMTIRDLLQRCIDDHLNKRGELHCWIDPEGEGGVFSAYGVTASRSYLVCMAAFYGDASFDGEMPVDDEIEDEEVNRAFNIRCRGTYMGTYNQVMQALSRGVPADQLRAPVLNL